MFEAVAIRKQGFPFRLSHKEFAERYALIAGMDAGSAAPLKICKGIIDSMKFPAENIQIGKTKVLYRAAEYRKLEVGDDLIDVCTLHQHTPRLGTLAVLSSFLGLRTAAAFTACLSPQLDWSIKMKHKTINDNLETMSKVDTSGMSKAEKEKFFMKLAKVSVVKLWYRGFGPCKLCPTLPTTVQVVHFGALVGFLLLTPCV